MAITDEIRDCYMCFPTKLYLGTMWPVPRNVSFQWTVMKHIFSTERSVQSDIDMDLII